MNEDSTLQKKYFTEEELLELHSMHDSVLEEVYCYLWVNRQSNPAMDLIVALEIQTDRGNTFISIHDTDEALEINRFDFNVIKEQLQQEFGEKIKVFRVPASDTGMWKDCKGKKIQAVELTKEEGQYLSDSLLLNFGSEIRLVQASPIDGLVIDYYEKDI
ncbi:MAG: hypothetical protein N3F09_09560 [Bacteroidia bacterium]|nr:hypothetical protein [Bacteroidia bacterium]